MARQIYVNLPVKELKRTSEFFGALGFAFEPKFSNDDAICMIIADNIFVMLLVERFFQTFIKKEVCDAKKSTEVLLCLSCDSRDHVNALVAKAVAAGGSIPRDAKDHGFMYEHAFEDPDGHIWELIYMEPDAAPAD
ncbi:VOC family protein [Aromatoleum diolicum]|uniref:Glyoxalase/bleomycin resistance/extradiol dioxygenase family protein n=1 Tax=Aromatoleum diolicum TaxID=75796 RepID=A0ABX1QAL5_9RHOO|nr:VOC family protein [Aromatoleum diolicum]NMG75428.1 glyoxalase/bleomycin resistance/extradiol dioxygenase family protein [Aromatoleum diolicum]